MSRPSVQVDVVAADLYRSAGFEVELGAVDQHAAVALEHHHGLADLQGDALGIHADLGGTFATARGTHAEVVALADVGGLVDADNGVHVQADVLAVDGADVHHL